MDRRRLTGTIWAKESEYLTLVDAQRELVEGTNTSSAPTSAVILGDLLKFENRVHVWMEILCWMRSVKAMTRVAAGILKQAQESDY